MADLPIFYSFRRCPYAMRARLAIAASGLSVELREVVLKNKPAELLAASAKGTVPVLVLPNGQVIDESLDVMLWALGQHDPYAWLEPKNAEAAVATMADMLALIAANDGAFKHSLDRYKYPHRYATEQSDGDAPSFAQTHRRLGATWLCALESRLEGGYLFGSRASLADMALLPFTRQFAHTDTAWFAAQPWPCLQAWLAAFEASSLYAGVMGKHTPWPSSQAADSVQRY